MKKRLFNIKLYLEGIKQLKLMGSLFFIMALLTSAIEPVKHIFATHSSVKYILRNITEFAPLLTIFMFICPVLYTFYLFSFLNKRKKSDFYHSIPHTRLCQFFSFTGAILTWIYITIIVTVLSTYLLYIISDTIVNPNFVPRLIFTYIAGSTLTVAAALIGKAITGTLFTNIVMTVLITLLPRFVCYVFTNTVLSIVGIANRNDFGILANINYNIPFKFILNVMPFSTADEVQLFTYKPSILYSFVLAAIYFIIAAFLYKKRKSETAEKSAPNNILQHVYRCCITLPFTIGIPCTIVAFIEKIKYREERLSGEYGTLIMFTVISIIVYFAFELITTKKLKNLVKAIPVFFVVIVFDIAFGLSIVLTNRYIVNLTPSASEIKSVTFSYNSEQNQRNYGSENTYNTIMLDTLQYKEPRLLEIVSEGLKKTVNIYKENGIYFVSSFEMKIHIPVKIKLKSGKSIERDICVDEGIIKEIESIKKANKENYNISISLPPEGNINSVEITGLNNKEAIKIWESFKEEYKSLKPEDKEFIVSNPFNTMSSNSNAIDLCFHSLTIHGNVGINNFMNIYRITNKTPKTCRLILEYLNSVNGKDFYGTLDKISQNKIHFYQYEFAGVYYMNKDSGKIEELRFFNIIYNENGRYQSRLPKEADKKILEILKQQEGKVPNLDKPLAGVRISMKERPFNEITLYVNIDQETVDIIAEMTKNVK